MKSARHGWREERIGSLVTERVSQGPPKKRVRYIEISGVDRNRKRIVDAPEIDPKQAPTRARQWIKAGDVLVSLTRPNLNAVALVPPDLDGALASTGFDVLRSEKVLPSWLMYRVQSPDFVNDVCQGLQGVVYPAIRPKEVRAHRLPVPPMDEQKLIVEALDSYFSRLDAVETGLDRVQRNLKRYRASVLQAAVTGRLVPTEAALARAEGRDFEPASDLVSRILLERRMRWKEAGKKGSYPEPQTPETAALPGLPEGWCWATLDQLARVGTGATPNRGQPRYWVKGKIPWVTSAVVNKQSVREPSGFVTEAAFRETNLSLYPPGTLLIAMYGEGKTRGRVCELVIEATTNQAIAAVVLDALAEPLKRWILLSLKDAYERLRRTASGGVQPNLNLSLVRAIEIPIPPLSEARRAAEHVERLLSIQDQAKLDLDRCASSVSVLRRRILTSAFAGELVESATLVAI